LLGHTDQEITSKVYRRVGEVVKPTNKTGVAEIGIKKTSMKAGLFLHKSLIYGGEAGIRTLGGDQPSTVFKSL
jgi:hypothetical protein